MSITPNNHGKDWSPEQIKKLRELAKGNTPTGLIAWMLQRTPEAINNKASEKGISLKPTNKSPYNRLKNKN